MSDKTKSPPKPLTKKKLTKDELFSLLKNAQLNQNIPPLPPGYPDPNKPPAKKKLSTKEIFDLFSKSMIENQNVPTPPPGYKFPTDKKEKDKKK